MKTGIFVVIALGAVVWGFAVVGIVNVVHAIGPSDVSTPTSLLPPTDAGLETAQIATLPEYPGGTRSEFRQELFVDELVTEIAYTVDTSTQQVRGHYRDIFDRRGWTMTGSTSVPGAWTYAVSLGARQGVVEIERRDGVTEVAVKITEPSTSRGSLADR